MSMMVDADMKRSFKINTIKLVIGLVLLSFSYVYLQTHEAEKTAVFSGFRVMYQRFSLFWAKHFTDNETIMKQKYMLDRYYSEIVQTASLLQCLPEEEMMDLQMTYDNFKKESINTLPRTYHIYVEKAQYFKTQLDEVCE